MCIKILDEEGIRFAGIINRMGNLEVGGFGKRITPNEDSEKQKMMFMQFVLMYNMRKECDDTSGQLDYIMTKREKSKILCIPIDNKLLLLSAESYVDMEKFAQKLKKIHDFIKDNHNEKEDIDNKIGPDSPKNDAVTERCMI
jgi:hypothetical protein